MRMQDLLAQARSELRYEPTEKRVRADGVVDSTRALLVWEPRRVVPSYAVPEADISAPLRPAPVVSADAPGVLHPGIPFGVHSAAGEPVSIGEREGAGFRLAELGHVVLDFKAFDAWYEEDERVFGHPRDPFHRIDVRLTNRPVRIALEGAVLAESTQARMLFETNLPTRFYLPREDVRVPLLPSAQRTYCAYKGEASYFNDDLIWSYEQPLPDAAPIAGLVAFWDDRVDVFLDGERRARPGGAIAAALKDEFGL